MFLLALVESGPGPGWEELAGLHRAASQHGPCGSCPAAGPAGPLCFGRGPNVDDEPHFGTPATVCSWPQPRRLTAGGPAPELAGGAAARPFTKRPRRFCLQTGAEPLYDCFVVVCGNWGGPGQAATEGVAIYRGSSTSVWSPLCGASLHEGGGRCLQTLLGAGGSQCCSALSRSEWHQGRERERIDGWIGWGAARGTKAVEDRRDGRGAQAVAAPRGIREVPASAAQEGFHDEVSIPGGGPAVQGGFHRDSQRCEGGRATA
mmetsp:Transcript_84796/g.226669  ORF Transcript_84796/g.226669 Transcript_84796/m.226669 type:complete len:261 (+) Transcript_84796:534-1316(+)